MKKLLILLFSLLISSNSYGGLFDKTVCVETETVERGGLIYLPNKTKPFSGKNLCEYESGQYKSQGKIKKGVKDGKWTYWFKNGAIKPESEYKDGVKIVPPICNGSYLPNNTDLEESGDFYSLKNDNIPFSGTTICRVISDDDNYGWFDMKLTWELGLPAIRNEKAYYPNGNQMWDWNQTFFESMPVGKQTEWYENGQIKQEQNYNEDGMEDGKFIYWNEDGKKEKEVNWKDGKKDGKRVFFYPSGQIYGEENYKNDEEDGKFTSWHKNGQKESEGNAKEGEMEGKFTEWNENGQIESESNWKDGKCVSGDCD